MIEHYGSMIPPIYVVIATSMGRVDLLFRRSLLSVYRQAGILAQQINVLVVDDNELEQDGLPVTFETIQRGVRELRESLGLRTESYPTHVLPNTRTKFHSGTGAWNTGISFAFEQSPTSFVAILDDDDEFLPNHLHDCIEQAKSEPSLEAIFQKMQWKNQRGSLQTPTFSREDLTEESFFVGNPGIQGSNLFIKTSTLVEIGGFDESLTGSTDRDLMIRLLCHFKKKYEDLSTQKTFQVLDTVGVIHYDHSNPRVSQIGPRKHEALDLFYQKHRSNFSEVDYQASLLRAFKLFQYQPKKERTKECFCLCMAMHNNAATVEKAINSVFFAKKTKRDILLIVSDDASSDESVQVVEKLQYAYPNILLFRNSFKSAYENRNWLQHYVLKQVPKCVLIGRLDADDALADESILVKIEALWETRSFDILLMANRQVVGDTPTNHINRPNNDLLDANLLLARLKRMSEGEWEAELPSCNMFVRPQVARPYPPMESAEDHWNVVDYLLDKDTLDICVQPEWVYANYRIDNYLYKQKEKKQIRASARKELYRYATQQIRHQERKQRAHNLLQCYRSDNYHYLGSGFSGVVFHDGAWVYKVHIPIATNYFNESDHILFLKEKLRIFDNKKHFFALKDLVCVQGVYILIYPYLQSEKVTSLSSQDMISFLAEMWEMKVMCRSITKENNFVRVQGVVKLIDYEIEPYNDNLFLNMAARAFIQLHETGLEEINYNKLKRSTINQFELTELDGFFTFLSNVFELIAEKTMISLLSDEKKMPSKFIPAAHYDGFRNPSVTLLIKACIQDSATLYNDIQFLVRQLPRSVSFHERVLLLDLYKSDNFLRQYNNKCNKNELLQAAQSLVEDHWIDRILISPESIKEIQAVNTRWFGVDAPHTHTRKKVPVVSQLYAFENIKSDYILQVDEDILIGKRCEQHDFLKKPLQAFQKHPHAVTIGFQIYHGEEGDFQAYSGVDGTIPPDVRCCIINRKRLFNHLPLENHSHKDGWEYSWYRSLEREQKRKGICSLRGGETNTFYAHIQNYRKADRKVWWIIMEAFRQGFLPEKQIGEPEIRGHIFDWTLPKRTEFFVVILLLDTMNQQEAEKTIQSILYQEGDFGLIIYNNTGSRSVTEFLDTFPRTILQRITLIFPEENIPYNEAIYDSIHYYISDQDSFLCLMRQGDLLLSRFVFSDCIQRLENYNADLLLGKEISPYTLRQNGLSASNFLHPRQAPETLMNGLIIFRKYLFDALSHLDLKRKKTNAQEALPGYTKIKNNHQWLDDPTGLSFIVPLIELSQNPIRFDHYNVLRTRIPSVEKIEQVVNFLHKKSSKKEGAWEKGRKTFFPNLARIELDITYDCNLKCLHCNRSCTQAPTQTHMTFEQIKTFIRDSVEQKKEWELVNILGGEPTLHPQFEEIVRALLDEYIIPHSPKTILQITSNGYGGFVKEKLANLPKHSNLVINDNSFKEDRSIPYFTPFNFAPIDLPEGDQLEYSKGCWVTEYCGVGLNHLGYFACGVAGGIERVARFGGGVSSLVDATQERLQSQLETYCQLCGNFCGYAPNRGDFMSRSEKDTPPQTAMSKTWKQLYRRYNKSNHVMDSGSHLDDDIKEVDSETNRPTTWSLDTTGNRDKED